MPFCTTLAVTDRGTSVHLQTLPSGWCDPWWLALSLQHGGIVSTAARQWVGYCLLEYRLLILSTGDRPMKLFSILTLRRALIPLESVFFTVALGKMPCNFTGITSSPTAIRFEASKHGKLWL